MSFSVEFDVVADSYCPQGHHGTDDLDDNLDELAVRCSSGTVRQHLQLRREFGAGVTRPPPGKLKQALFLQDLIQTVGEPRAVRLQRQHARGIRAVWWFVAGRIDRPSLGRRHRAAVERGCKSVLSHVWGTVPARGRVNDGLHVRHDSRRAGRQFALLYRPRPN
jgi:hypothetical protein